MGVHRCTDHVYCTALSSEIYKDTNTANGVDQI